MSTIERLTITVPTEMAATVRNAVEAGDYASTSEVARKVFVIRTFGAKRGAD